MKKGMREMGWWWWCGCSLGEPLRRQETFQTSLYIETSA